ncbi:MAG: hypothetical protein DRJ42_25645, partial [Deltaproteobacteria bacterium]
MEHWKQGGELIDGMKRGLSGSGVHDIHATNRPRPLGRDQYTARGTRSNVGTTLCFAILVAGCAAPTSPSEPSAGSPAEALSMGGVEGERGARLEADDGGAISVFRSAVYREDLTEETLAIRRTSPRPPPLDDRTGLEVAIDFLQATAAERASDDQIRVLVTLPDPESSDWIDGVARLEETDRHAAIDRRRTRLRPSQDDMDSDLRALGARVLGRHWIHNSLIAEVPAGLIPRLLEIPNADFAIAEAEVRLGANYDGLYLSEYTNRRYLDLVGFYGESRGRVSSPSDNIKIAIVEGTNHLNVGHPGWLDYPGGPTRIKAYKSCDSGSCSTMISATPPHPHATQVAWAAAGSIEQGQDPNFPYPGDQLSRSGMLREAEIYFYSPQSAAGVVSAFQEAITDGVDVFNYSTGMSGCGEVGACDPRMDCIGINATLKAVADAGIVTTACGGNCGGGGTACNEWYPAIRSEALAVSALASSIPTPGWDLELSSDVCRGNVPVTTVGGLTATTAGIGIVAPGDIRNYFDSTSNGYVATGVGGCSIAAPIVAGGVGALRDALKYFGWGANDARMLMTNLFVLADATNGTTPFFEVNNRVDDWSGYGRMWLHWPNINAAAGPSDPWLAAPFGWGWRTFVIYQGQTVEWSVGSSAAEPSGITEWKWALMWTESDFTQVADIIIEAIDKCDGDRVLRSDVTFSLRKRIHMDGSEVAGKCVYMRARGL